MDDYMEQEEEWEREGLLDPAWEKQQKKVSEIIRLVGLPLSAASLPRNFAIFLVYTTPST